MKIFKLIAIALVAMLGFTACEKDCGHDFIEHNHSADLVGTWTFLSANFTEALTIKADGTLVSTGVADGAYWEDIAGKIVVEDNNVTLSFVDGDTFEGHIDIIPGVAFSIYNEQDGRFIFNYCENDLSDEIIGMWVCHDTPAEGESEMMIETFDKNGKSTLTGFLPLEADAEQILNNQTDYRVVGDLLFITIPADKVGGERPQYVVHKLTYSPEATTTGDIMTFKSTVAVGNEVIEGTSFWLRVKQSLDLAGKKYDYIKTFVSNVDGLDQDIDFMGYTFNFAKMDGTTIDQMLKALLFSVEFPSANKIKYSCRFSSGVQTVEAPIAVDGNKMTLKMSELYPTAKDVDLYTFQDADCSQMHMYMPTYAFINFFGNMQVIMMSQLGQLDTNNAEAVKAVFDSIDAAVNTINVSFVMTKAAK